MFRQTQINGTWWHPHCENQLIIYAGAAATSMPFKQKLYCLKRLVLEIAQYINVICFIESNVTFDNLSFW